MSCRSGSTRLSGCADLQPSRVPRRAQNRPRSMGQALGGSFDAQCGPTCASALKTRRSSMNPRPEVVVDMDRLALRHGCTDAELHAAIDALKRSTRKGRPKSEFYGPLEWGMFALVGIYGKNRFTAA